MGRRQHGEVSCSMPWAGPEAPEQEHPGKVCHAPVCKTALLMDVAESD